MVKLRPYQDLAVAELLVALVKGEPGALLESPVGSGKTTIAMEVINRIKHLPYPVAWFTHRVELADQASDRAHDFSLPHGRISPISGLSTHKLHICSIDTVRARLAELLPWLRSIRVAFFDEGQHMGADTWDLIASAMPNAQLVLLSGSPWRLDGKPLNLSGRITVVVKCPGVRPLTELGYLAPAIIYAPPTDLDMSKVKKRGGDYALNEMAEAVKKAALAKIGRLWYATHAPGQPAIVFCPTVEMAEQSAATYRAAGWRAYSVDGSMSANDRNRVVGGLANGDTQILTSVSVISEGYDCPAVSVCILERPTMSTGLYIQMIGRCLRPHEDKSHATVLDLVGNTYQHGFYDAHRPWSLEEGLSGTEQAIAATWRCRNCHRVHEITSANLECSCGALQAGRNKVSAAASGHPPIAGIAANDLITMRFVDAVPLIKTRSELVQFAKLRNAPHPVRWAREILEKRERER